MNYRSVLSRFFILILVTVTIFGFGLQVQAAPTLTPKAAEYQVDQTTSKIEFEADKLKGKGAAKAQEAQKTAGNIKDEVVDKLNLDEPLPSDTKKFFRQLKGEEGVYED